MPAPQSSTHDESQQTLVRRHWLLGREKLYCRLPIHRRATLETEWRARPASILFGILPSVPIPQSLAVYPDSLL